MFIWDDSLSTGAEEIDKQHKELLERFSEFTDALAKGKARQETGEMLDFLQFYARWHFQREEECMERHRCPVAARNKHAHAQFITRFQELYDDYQVSSISPELAHRTYIELQSWLINHIKSIDTELNHCLQVS